MKRILTILLFTAALAALAHPHGASIPPPPDMDTR